MLKLDRDRLGCGAVATASDRLRYGGRIKESVATNIKCWRRVLQRERYKIGDKKQGTARKKSYKMSRRY